jgi:hypothetical protein
MKRLRYCLMSLAIAALLGIQSQSMTASAKEFNGTIVLGRPACSSVTASVTTEAESEIYLSYGAEAGSHTRNTERKNATSESPAVFIMDDLSSDAVYYYVVRFRVAGTSDFSESEEYSFRTPKTGSAEYNFTVQSDSHLLNKADPALYTQSMQTMASLSPDFMFDLGDAFLMDNGNNDPSTMTQEQVNEIYRQQLPYFTAVARSAPLFLTIGNHESEYGPMLDGTMDNLAAKSTLGRLTYYPNPVPNGFYSGNTENDPLFGSLQNYYAFTWGDALYVSIDPYRYGLNGASGDNKGDGWGWTLGKTQYDWFRKTLEMSTAKYKFVFSHHAIGNMRGGAEIAKLYEWGGCDKNGAYLFDEKRPGWGKPIQQIMKDTGVTIFFQGHDHLYARENVDGVVYQTIPKPAEKIADHQNNFSSFPDGDVMLNSGFLNVTVSENNVRVDYNRNYLVASGEQTTGVVSSYTVDPDHQVTVLKTTVDDLSLYGQNGTETPKGNKSTRESKGTKQTQNTKQTKSAKQAQSAGESVSANGTGNTAAGVLSAAVRITAADQLKQEAAEGKKGQGNQNSQLADFVGVGAVPAGEMTPVPDEGFSFAVEADPHFDEHTDSAILDSTAAHINAVSPSFLIDLGDASMLEKLGKTPEEAEKRKALVQDYFSKFGDLPVKMVTGNHDGPINTGNGNYYSFTQNNTLFIVLDPYAYSTDKGGGWATTLGKTQYDWLEKTLMESTETFKFVFIHNLTGGLDKNGRGGAEAADFYEWGGKNASGADEFAAMRPGWDIPIHDLLVKYGVQAVFHGHDHFYDEQEKDGIVYQLVPQAGSPGNSVNDAPDFGYVSGVRLPSAGFLRVVVSADQATVEYIKTENDGTSSIPAIYTISK